MILQQGKIDLQKTAGASDKQRKAMERLVAEHVAQHTEQAVGNMMAGVVSKLSTHLQGVIAEMVNTAITQTSAKQVAVWPVHKPHPRRASVTSLESVGSTAALVRRSVGRESGIIHAAQYERPQQQRSYKLDRNRRSICSWSRHG